MDGTNEKSPYFEEDSAKEKSVFLADARQMFELLKEKSEVKAIVGYLLDSVSGFSMAPEHLTVSDVGAFLDKYPTPGAMGPDMSVFFDMIERESGPEERSRYSIAHEDLLRMMGEAPER